MATAKKQAASKSPKTQPTGASVSAFLAKAAAGRIADAKAIVAMMETATKQKAKMWGDAIVGCDTYGVKYADGRVEEWPLVAMSPRAKSFAFYMAWKKHPDLVKKLGKHKAEGGCLHVASLADVDAKALQALITAAAKSRKAAAAR